jgi:predicted alpha/beta superfamily hydrolase
MRLTFLISVTKITLWICFSSAVILCTSYAQESEQNYIIGKAIKIRSAVLNEERTLLINLPDDYDVSQRRYPVLFLLDGDAHFHHVTGIVHFFTVRNMIPPLIVIALPNIDRTRDFSPTSIDKRLTSGGADRFLEFFQEELIPYVDSHYRTHPYRIIVGHSLGGLFAIYALLTQPDVFNAYIAISPSLSYDNELLLKKASAFLEKSPELKKFLFMTVGNEPKYIPRLESFSKILEEMAPEGLEWKYTYMEKEDHVSITHRSIYDGLETLYLDWRVSASLIQKGLDGIQEHYRTLSEKFGYEIPVLPRVYNLLGYDLIKKKKMNEAIEVFELCINDYPLYWYAYSNLGYCYMLEGNKELAIKNLEKALELNPSDRISAQRLKKLKEEKISTLDNTEKE